MAAEAAHTWPLLPPSLGLRALRARTDRHRRRHRRHGRARGDHRPRRRADVPQTRPDVRGALHGYAGGWEEVRFLPRQEQTLQVRDGQTGGDPRLGGRSCSDERRSEGEDDHLPRLCLWLHWPPRDHPTKRHSNLRRGAHEIGMTHPNAPSSGLAHGGIQNLSFKKSAHDFVRSFS